MDRRTVTGHASAGGSLEDAIDLFISKLYTKPGQLALWKTAVGVHIGVAASHLLNRAVAATRQPYEFFYFFVIGVY